MMPNPEITESSFARKPDIGFDLTEEQSRIIREAMHPGESNLLIVGYCQTRFNPDTPGIVKLLAWGTPRPVTVAALKAAKVVTPVPRKSRLPRKFKPQKPE